MTKLRLALASFALVAFASIAIGQGAGFFPNWPIVTGSSYCASYTNAVCTQTIPAGPTSVTGLETVPANTSLGNRSPANVLLPMSAFNALPISFNSLSGTATANLSMSAIYGGVVIISSGNLTTVNVSLPSGVVHGQQFALASNRLITTLRVAVTPGSGHTLDSNTTPTVLSTNTVGGPMNYRWVYDTTSTTWYRLQ